jgi:hypothetical protein
MIAMNIAAIRKRFTNASLHAAKRSSQRSIREEQQ